MCFSALTATAYAQQVKADTGGVAIGGSVTGSTINIGIPQAKVDELVRDAKRPLEELTALQRDSIALLKEKLDLNLGQVRAALNIVGEKQHSARAVGCQARRNRGALQGPSSNSVGPARRQPRNNLAEN